MATDTYFLFSFLFLDIENQMVQIFDGERKAWQCTVCSYVTKNKTHMAEHIDAKHIERSGLPCPYCFKICPNVKSLKNHMYNQHKKKQQALT